MNINLVIWYNFFPLQQLGVNVLGVVCIFAWTTIWITALFLLLKFVNLHRVTEEEELDGKYSFISIRFFLCHTIRFNVFFCLTIRNLLFTL